MVHYKFLGYSTYDFTPEQMEERGKMYSVCRITLDVLTNNTLACVKLSAVFFYRRIFSVGGKRSMFRIVTGVTIGVVILWLVVFRFLVGFQCGTHFSALWDGAYLQYCTLLFPFSFGLVVSDFLLDILILVLPIPSILHLHTNMRRKLSIIGIFLLAFVGLGASIVRMVKYIEIDLGGPGYFFQTEHDRLITQSYFYTMLEAGIALIAVNLPSLRAFSATPETGGAVRNARGFVELPILRDSNTGIERNASVAPTTSGTSGIDEEGRAAYFNIV
ncbi:uncharacterized protein F4817DRAFT_342824 [Daldinia loculata]|uniref:uncharacterized protein n=1 Tax=Daldinia loculata TaxID=103429 RepID=UPI0020C2EBE8|nr:uncharacterized protein F4817DRAFT_342824 [Daldinia loculata]KAI1645720.1 hypothetical protein F4817DRAFT_342824 [Daldinia loculata]